MSKSQDDSSAAAAKARLRWVEEAARYIYIRIFLSRLYLPDYFHFTSAGSYRKESRRIIFQLKPSPLLPHASAEVVVPRRELPITCYINPKNRGSDDLLDSIAHELCHLYSALDHGELFSNLARRIGLLPNPTWSLTRPSAQFIRECAAFLAQHGEYPE